MLTAFSKFPLGKIVVHTVRHISRPIGRVAKNIAKTNPFFRRYFCTLPGQLYYNLEVRCKMYMLKMKQPRRVPPLPHDTATELGANLLGEVTILALAIYLIFSESSRQAAKDKKKHDEHHQQKQVVQDELDSLDKHVNDLNRQIQQLKAELNG